MARKKKGESPVADAPEPSTKRPRYQLDVDPDMLDQLEWITTMLRVKTPVWLNNQLRPIIQRVYTEVVEEYGPPPERWIREAGK